MKIGVFDSGIGGITVVTQLKTKKLYDLVYLADQAHLPYGSKDQKELLGLIAKNFTWFKQQRITTILIACNTASSLIEPLRDLFPELTLISISEVTAQQVANGAKVLVLGTAQTVKSNNYPKLLAKQDVAQLALPELASLIENQTDSATIKAYLAPLLCPFQSSQREIILACTHYPLVAPFIKELSNLEILPVDYSLITLPAAPVANLALYTTGSKAVMEQQLRDLFQLHLDVQEVYDEIFVGE